MCLKSPRLNLEQRAKLLLEAQTDKHLQNYLYEFCGRDILFWFYNFAWTYDPRLKGNKYIPFIPYEFQDELILQIKDEIENAYQGETVVIEKCRDMGLTWIIVSVFFWFWLFKDSSDFLIGSRKEEYVDKKKLPDTLFGKLDILQRKTPKWMLPVGFDLQKHSTHMVLYNPERGSMIKGESSNSDFSRSGRYKATLMDELAFWLNAASSHSAATESCNLIIAISTPNPEGSGFFKSELVDHPERYKVISLRHSLHPLKDAEWLKKQYEKKSPEMIAVEILLDYTGAITGKVYARAMRCEIDAKYDYDPGLPLFRSWDFGHGGDDPTVIHWYQLDSSNKLRLIDRYSKAEEDINFYAAIALGSAEKAKEFQELSKVMYTEKEMQDIERRSKWKKAVDFGDPYSANQRTFIGKTTITKELERHGIIINIKTGTTVSDRIEKGRQLMKRLVVHPRAITAIELIAQARFPNRSDNSQSVTPANKPVHDHTSHDRTAYEYLADNEARLLEFVNINTNTHPQELVYQW